MFGLIKIIFIMLLTSIISASNHVKCISLSNQKCIIQPTLTNLHPNEYNQELHYHLFAVTLDMCVRSCNALNDLYNKVYVPSKIEDLNLSMFSMITGIIELKTLTKLVSCDCKCKFDGRKYNSNQKWNNDQCFASVKNIIYVKKIIFGSLLHVDADMVNI